MTDQLPPLRPVGFFIELRWPVAGMPTLENSRGEMNPEAVEAVAAYLDRGIPVFDIMEATRDPFDADSEVYGGPSLISDGVWVWRYDLSYYVRRYAAGLPHDFIAHALRDEPLPAPAQVLERMDELLSVVGWVR